MAVTRFEGRGPVARYWLANCEGFVVKGGAHGVVEELIHDADSLVPTRLVVRTRTRRRTIVPAGDIESVVPANRVLIVERRQERRHVAPRGSVAAVRVAGERASRVLVPTAQAAGKKVALAGPPARSAASATARRTAVLAREAWPPAKAAAATALRELRRVSRPALLVLASSLRLLEVEARASARLVADQVATFMSISAARVRRRYERLNPTTTKERP